MLKLGEDGASVTLYKYRLGKLFLQVSKMKFSPLLTVIPAFVKGKLLDLN